MERPALARKDCYKHRAWNADETDANANIVLFSIGPKDRRRITMPE